MGESQDQSLEAETLTGGMRNRWNQACPWLSAGAFGAVILIAVLLRIGLILAWPQPIEGTDAMQYLRIAVNLVEGNGYSLWPSPPYDPDVYRSPGYPLFLAAGFRAGLDLSGIIAVQIILELTTLFIGADLIARRVSPSAGRAAFSAAVLCPFTSAFSCLIMSEALSVFLINALFLFTLAHLGFGRAALLGATLGWLILTRSGFLPLLILLPLFLAVSPPVVNEKQWGKAGTVFITALLVLLPYASWNASTHGRFSLTPLSGFGRAIWGGVGMMPGMGLPGIAEETWRDHFSIWESGDGRPSAAHLIATDKELTRIALTEIRARPLAYLKGTARHALHIWVGVRNLFVHNNPPIQGWILRLLGILYFGLGLIGLARLPLSRSTRLLMTAPAVTMALVLPWLWVEMRYTSVLFGPISLLAGTALVRKPRS